MSRTTLPVGRSSWWLALPLLALLLLPGSGMASSQTQAEWKLVDEGACEGAIITYTEGYVPEEARCTPKMAGKAAICYTEVCLPHCLYFDYPLEKCSPGADLAKRYTCVAD